MGKSQKKEREGKKSIFFVGTKLELEGKNGALEIVKDFPKNETKKNDREIRKKEEGGEDKEEEEEEEGRRRGR